MQTICCWYPSESTKQLIRIALSGCGGKSARGVFQVKATALNARQALRSQASTASVKLECNKIVRILDLVWVHANVNKQKHVWQTTLCDWLGDFSNIARSEWMISLTVIAKKESTTHFGELIAYTHNEASNLQWSCGQAPRWTWKNVQITWHCSVFFFPLELLCTV